MVKIIISGVNIDSGGPLSIYKDCLLELTKSNYTVIALVHDRNLFEEFTNIKIIEIKKAKNNYLLRFFYEYVYFYFLSLKLKPNIWLSLHDMTPNVKADVRAVYCHNPSPFYTMNELEKKLDRKMWLFNKFYSLIYKINLLKNDFVIVQQDWIANKFVQYYFVEPSKLIVAKPQIKIQNIVSYGGNNSTKLQFFYPAFPRSFKNFEIICEAVSILNKQNYLFEVVLTIDGTENNYSRYIVNKFRDLANIKFIGLISRDIVYDYYLSSDCLIFSSRLETWGLPISEYQQFNKPMLVADLPYAIETVGDYELVEYFDPLNANYLSKLMSNVISGERIFTRSKRVCSSYRSTTSWLELFNILSDKQQEG